MSPRVGRAVLVWSAMGFPLTQRVIRRFGFGGALVVEAACGGLLARDAAMIAAGVKAAPRCGRPALARGGGGGGGKADRFASAIRCHCPGTRSRGTPRSPRDRPPSSDRSAFHVAHDPFPNLPTARSGPAATAPHPAVSVVNA